MIKLQEAIKTVKVPLNGCLQSIDNKKLFLPDRIIAIVLKAVKEIEEIKFVV